MEKLSYGTMFIFLNLLFFAFVIVFALQASGIIQTEYIPKPMINLVTNFLTPLLPNRKTADSEQDSANSHKQLGDSGSGNADL